MIRVRDIVVFISKHKDGSRYFVKELRHDQKALIQKFNSTEEYIVPVTDLKVSH